MKIVKLWGGLGNQMFQYAFGKTLAIENSKQLYFHNFNQNKTESELDILHFNVGMNFIKDKDLNIFYLKPNLTYRFLRKLYYLFPWLNRKINVEQSLKYNCNNLLPSEAEYYDGYWQSYKYFEPIKDQITKDFQIKKEKVLNQKKMDEIISTNSVSVHIRRGDYLSKVNQKIYATCDLDYYSIAINEVQNKTNNPVFYIFSNDLKLAKEALSEIKNSNFIYVDNNHYKDAHIQDFIMMSCCKHNILANSSFSWWAAWLNENTEKYVIAPKQWYKGKLNETIKDLIPSEWIRI